MKRAWVCSECGKLFKTRNERDKHKQKCGIEWETDEGMTQLEDDRLENYD